jgi:hypothetical protein
MESKSWIYFPAARDRLKDGGKGKRLILKHDADTKITGLKYIQ